MSLLILICQLFIPINIYQLEQEVGGGIRRGGGLLMERSWREGDELHGESDVNTLVGNFRGEGETEGGRGVEGETDGNRLVGYL